MKARGNLTMLFVGAAAIIVVGMFVGIVLALIIGPLLVALGVI